MNAELWFKARECSPARAIRSRRSKRRGVSVRSRASFARSTRPIRNFMRVSSHAIGAFDDQGFALFERATGASIGQLRSRDDGVDALREKSVDGRIGLFAGVNYRFVPKVIADLEFNGFIAHGSPARDPLRRIRIGGLVARMNADLGSSASEYSPARDPLTCLKQHEGSVTV